MNKGEDEEEKQVVETAEEIAARKEREMEIEADRLIILTDWINPAVEFVK